MLTFLAEFLFSAVLWGSLITWWLWRWRKRAQSGFARKLLALPLFWFALQTAFGWYGLLLPPSGRLVDADSGAPIPNVRVVANWIGFLPPALWTTYCSGKQAHLSDAQGEFAFPFAPVPTLFAGVLGRGLNPLPTARIAQRRLAFGLEPLRGDMPVSQYAPGRKLGGGPNTGCDVEIGSQYPSNLRVLPGEEHPFERTYREACIEQQTWSLTDAYLHDLVRSSRIRIGELADDHPLQLAPPLPMQEAIRRLAPDGCPPIGNRCVRAVIPEVRSEICTYLQPLHNIKGESS